MNIPEAGFFIEKDFISNEIRNLIVDDISRSSNDYPSHGIRNAEKKFTTIQQLVSSYQRGRPGLHFHISLTMFRSASHPGHRIAGFLMRTGIDM